MTVGRILIKTYIFISLSWAFLKTGKKLGSHTGSKWWPGDPDVKDDQNDPWTRWSNDPVPCLVRNMYWLLYILDLRFVLFLCTTAVWQFAINEYVMLCYLSNYISDLHQFLCNLTHGCGSILLWRRNMFRTFGFRDGVIFAHSQGCSTSPPSWSAVHTQPWAWLQNVRSNRLPVAGQRTHWTTFRALKVTSQVATQGAAWLPCFNKHCL